MPHLFLLAILASCGGSDRASYGWDEDEYFEDIVLTMDGVSTSYGDGQFRTVEVVPATGAECVPSILLEIDTTAWNRSDGPFIMTWLIFESEFRSGSTASLPVAPYEEGSFPAAISTDGTEDTLGVLSGGTSLFEQNAEDVYQIAISDTSWCGPLTLGHSAFEVEPDACSDIGTVTLDIDNAVLGHRDEPYDGVDGWEGAAGEPICIPEKEDVY